MYEIVGKMGVFRCILSISLAKSIENIEQQ